MFNLDSCSKNTFGLLSRDTMLLCNKHIFFSSLLLFLQNIYLAVTFESVHIHTCNSHPSPFIVYSSHFRPTSHKAQLLVSTGKFDLCSIQYALPKLTFTIPPPTTSEVLEHLTPFVHFPTCDLYISIHLHLDQPLAMRQIISFLTNVLEG
ncbi:hypothetical protein BC943DRAFT_193317 [Umbelopsis sp. AD052]|nr:hypothetical protein BC943DRAFT_193317 [Umbelopsis sp. AD052]